MVMRETMSAGLEIAFRFESTEERRYVGVLENSGLVSGTVVTQNAGSTNVGIYYQVGGGGLNGVFLPVTRNRCWRSKC
jgi:hypothetical protein